MSAALLIASRSESAYSLTIGNSSNVFGFSTGGAYGGISSTNFRGMTLYNIIAYGGPFPQYSLQLAIRGVSSAPPQDCFFSVVALGTDGRYRTFQSASAIYTAGISPNWNSIWEFESFEEADPVWTATTPSPRAVRFIF